METKYTWSTRYLPRDVEKKLMKLWKPGNDIFDLLDPESVNICTATTGEFSTRITLDYRTFGTITFPDPFVKNGKYTVYLGIKKPFEKDFYAYGPTKGPNWPFRD